MVIYVVPSANPVVRVTTLAGQPFEMSVAAVGIISTFAQNVPALFWTGMTTGP